MVHCHKHYHYQVCNRCLARRWEVRIPRHKKHDVRYYSCENPQHMPQLSHSLTNKFSMLHILWLSPCTIFKFTRFSIESGNRGSDAQCKHTLLLNYKLSIRGAFCDDALYKSTFTFTNSEPPVTTQSNWKNMHQLVTHSDRPRDCHRNGNINVLYSGRCHSYCTATQSLTKFHTGINKPTTDSSDDTLSGT